MEGISLMDRQDGGVTVELCYVPEDLDSSTPVDQLLYIRVTDPARGRDESAQQIAVVPAPRAWDAFWHPFTYLPASCTCLRCKVADACVAEDV